MEAEAKSYGVENIMDVKYPDIRRKFFDATHIDRLVDDSFTFCKRNFLLKQSALTVRF